MKRAALVSFVAAVLVLLWAPLASAHTSLVTTSPADGDVLADVPAEITLQFDENLLPETVVVSVADGQGLSVRVAQPTVDGGLVSVVTPPGLTPPNYTVSYRVVSEDGHPVTGSFTFRAGTAPSPVAAPASTRASASPSVAAAATSDASGGSTAGGDSSGGITPGVMIAVGLAIGIGAGVGIALWSRNRRSGSA